MKKLLYYKNFIYEASYTPEQSDPPEIISDMNTSNNTENTVKEYNQKKSVIENIYNNYTDEKDLINKLISQKFISKGDNVTNIIFNNVLLGMWAQSCEKQRELKDMNDQITKWGEDIKSQKLSLSKNPSSKESIESDISLTQSKIDQKNKELNQKKIDITNLQKNVAAKLKTLQDELNTSDKNINMYNKSKTPEK